ncbi:hypothetical protein WH158_06845 [Gluconobacter cerinus]|uniref:hypothetical protein n=1 Tax=Gluconobacter cerinus TaxID=38307 RepID=UPI0030960A15
MMVSSQGEVVVWRIVFCTVTSGGNMAIYGYVRGMAGAGAWKLHQEMSREGCDIITFVSDDDVPTDIESEQHLANMVSQMEPGDILVIPDIHHVACDFDECAGDEARQAVGLRGASLRVLREVA